MPEKIPKFTPLNDGTGHPMFGGFTEKDLKPQYDEVYSVGEIHALKLLKTRLNKPIKSKSHVSKIVRSLPFKKFITKTGHEANGLTIEQINEYNQNK